MAGVGSTAAAVGAGAADGAGGRPLRDGVVLLRLVMAAALGAPLGVDVGLAG